MNELEHLQRLWQQLRADYQETLLTRLKDANAAETGAEAVRLSNLNVIVTQALDGFQAQAALPSFQKMRL